jgi:riboflavin synthase
MFSGLIEHRGTVLSIEADPRGGVRLRVDAPSAVAQGIAVKDSIAINGVCLTAVAVDAGAIAFDVVPETLVRSTLGLLTPGDALNVELSLRAGDRIGGHYVYGHVDATARVDRAVPEGQGLRMFVVSPPALRPFIVEKGYVALDGVSVTIAAVDRETFAIALIPETLARTTLGARTPGTFVNVEVDPVARYVAGALAAMRGETLTPGQE